VSALIAWLQERCTQVDFFQALSLLEEYFAGPPTDELDADEHHIRLGAALGIGFPAADVAAIHYVPGKGIRMLMSFMGLVGVSSPLPHYFTEHALHYTHESEALTDFLNIFDHRIYTLFYQAWRKYRLVTQSCLVTSNVLLGRISCLSGRLPDAAEGLPAQLQMRYAGLFAAGSRNANGLEVMLADALDGVKVTVQQWVPRWAPVDSIKQLGQSICLGDNALLGERLFDRSGKIKIFIELTKTQPIYQYLAGSANIQLVCQLVNAYCTLPFEYDIEVRFPPQALVQICLGKETAGLGVNGCCGKAHASDKSYVITILQAHTLLPSASSQCRSWS
jgi:type VI secretion system protein ImpH